MFEWLNYSEIAFDCIVKIAKIDIFFKNILLIIFSIL